MNRCSFLLVWPLYKILHGCKSFNLGVANIWPSAHSALRLATWIANTSITTVFRYQTLATRLRQEDKATNRLLVDIQSYFMAFSCVWWLLTSESPMYALWTRCWHKNCYFSKPCNSTVRSESADWLLSGSPPQGVYRLLRLPLLFVFLLVASFTIAPELGNITS